MIKVTAETQAAQDDLLKTKIAIDHAVAKSWKNSTQVALRFMKHNGYFDRTGKLTKSMSLRFKTMGFLRIQSQVRADAHYALWVDQPTKPHPIDAKYAPFLVFFWGPPKGPGHVIFAKHVDHPGTRGALFSDNTRKHMLGRFQVSTQQAIDAVLTGAK